MKAKCSCESVVLSFAGKPEMFVNCHCSMCRNLSGGPYIPWLVFEETEFRIVQGHEYLKSFCPSDNLTVHFCHKCGGRLHTEDKRYPNFVSVFAGVTNIDSSHKPSKEVYYSSKVHWNESESRLPKYSGESGLEEL